MLQIFWTIKDPTNYNSQEGSGLFDLLSNIFKLAGVVAGIFFVAQLIIAGYGYISASGDPKKTEAAWNKIVQSIIGIAIVAGAFIVASVVGAILGIDIINPQIYGPN